MGIDFVEHVKSKLLLVGFNKYELAFLLFLLFLSMTPRFSGLGYSHFYGDETKVLYLDKTVPATEFFLNQRKGPVQFFVAWTVEKLTGGYNEFWIRLPFALAGVLAIFALYLVVKSLFGTWPAGFAALLFGLNGFTIAFARTAQYQSFLFLFGFLGLYFFSLFAKDKSVKSLWTSAVFYALALLSHYDALFFLIPAILMIKRKDIKQLAINFVLPLVFLVSLFYVPYFLGGYFEANTQGYVYRRIVGQNQSSPNNSIYTNRVYNPNQAYTAILFFGLCLAVFKAFNFSTLPFFVWTVLGYLVFEDIIKNPGTHIFNFIIPMIILVSVAFVEYFKQLESKPKLIIASAFVVMVLCVQAVNVYYIFIPKFGANYPWSDAGQRFSHLKRAQKVSQLFLYGFPYNRLWPQIAAELRNLGARSYYTNDNDDIAKYYVGDLPFTEPNGDFSPAYFVDVMYNQELKDSTAEFLASYQMVTEIKSSQDQSVVAKIYKLQTIQPN